MTVNGGVRLGEYHTRRYDTVTSPRSAYRYGAARLWEKLAKAGSAGRRSHKKGSLPLGGFAAGSQVLQVSGSGYAAPCAPSTRWISGFII